ncbi:iron complex outermembrane recepter protein [Alloalcanivorax xenomutans]|nr:iron complex outermembrane recepter protein [Alloalcanivorax xenomutans]
MIRRCLSCCLLVATTVLAAEPNRLDPVTVEAGNEAVHEKRELQRRLDDVPGATNLIDPGEKEGSQATLARVLDFEPGIIIQEFFGGNDQPRLNIRGSGIQDNPVSRGIQILYDGLPINQADGSFIIGLIDPEQTSLISVYRGANALRYGGTTLGGAIDFNMRTARNSPSSVSLEGGSWNTWRGSVALAEKKEQWDGYIRAGYQASDGWRSHSGAQRNTFVANFGYRGGNWINRTYLNLADNRFDIPFLLTKDRALSDPDSVMGDYADPDNKSTEDFLNVRVRQPERDTRQTRLANKTIWYTEQASHSLGLYAESIRDRFKNPAWQANTEAGNFGLDYGTEVFVPNTDGTEARYQVFLSANSGAMPREYYLVHPDDGSLERRFADLDLRASNVVGGAQVNYPLSRRWQAVAAFQYAWHQRNVDDERAPGLLDSELTYRALNPKLGLIYSPFAGTHYYANVSRSSEAPTFWQLVDLGPGSVPASPASLYLMTKPLEMQMANTFEVGARRIAGSFAWEGAYFYSRVKDELIAEVQNFAIDGTTVNYDHDTVHQGVELAVSARSGRGLFRSGDWLSVRGVYNYSDFRFHGGRYDGKRIAGIPVHLVTAELGYHWSRRLGLTLSARWQPQDTHVDHYNAGLKQDSYLLLGAALSYRPTPSWEWFLDLRNLTNETWQTAYVVRGLSAEDPESSLTAPTFVPGAEFHGYAGVTYRW